MNRSSDYAKTDPTSTAARSCPQWAAYACRREASQVTEIFDAEKAIAELEANGWKRKGHIWKSPWGALYLGPAYAYKLMLAVKDNPICPTIPGRRIA